MLNNAIGLELGNAYPNLNRERQQSFIILGWSATCVKN
jgi:hypothetical protein